MTSFILYYLGEGVFPPNHPFELNDGLNIKAKFQSSTFSCFYFDSCNKF